MPSRMDKETSAADRASELLVQTEEKAVKALTVLLEDLPQWMQDNHFLVRGYRTQSNSYRKSAASLTYLHNESVNIYTHLVGAIVAAVTGVITYVVARPRFTLATPEDVLVFGCFFLGAVACLGMSATYHTIANHSEAVSKFGNRLDYIGIVVLIWGSFIPSIYYGFRSEPNLVRVYWSMITTIGAGTVVVVLHPKFRTSAWRPFRAFMFVMMGLSAVFPVTHGIQLFGWQQLELQIGLSCLITQGALYIIGAAIYAVWKSNVRPMRHTLTLEQARIPERWKPGTFDIWGSSHQIFHVLVLLAAATHFVGLTRAFDYEHGYRNGLGSAREAIWSFEKTEL